MATVLWSRRPRPRHREVLVISAVLAVLHFSPCAALKLQGRQGSPGTGCRICNPTEQARRRRSRRYESGASTAAKNDGLHPMAQTTWVVRPPESFMEAAGLSDQDHAPSAPDGVQHSSPPSRNRTYSGRSRHRQAMHSHVRSTPEISPIRDSPQRVYQMSKRKGAYSLQNSGCSTRDGTGVGRACGGFLPQPGSRTYSYAQPQYDPNNILDVPMPRGEGHHTRQLLRPNSRHRGYDYNSHVETEPYPPAAPQPRGEHVPHRPASASQRIFNKDSGSAADEWNTRNGLQSRIISARRSQYAWQDNVTGKPTDSEWSSGGWW